MKNNKITFEVIEQHSLSCKGCFFNVNGICHNNLCEVLGNTLACTHATRKDGKTVIFKLIE